MVRKKKSHLLKRILIFGGIILFIFLALTGTNLYLFINNFLGNDIILKLSSSREDFFIKHGESEEVRFIASATANPFCEALCEFEFIDLSRDEVIDNGSIKLKPGVAISRKYDLNPNLIGEGQELYRFDMSCYSVARNFCHTEGEETKRSLLITIWNDLSDDEEELKNNTYNQIVYFDSNLDYFNNSLNLFSKYNEESNYTLGFNDLSVKINNTRQDYLIFEDNFRTNIIKLWNEQRYRDLNSEINEFNSSYLFLDQEFKDLNQTFYSNLGYYNDQFNYELNNKLNVLLAYDSLCEVYRTCLAYENINEISNSKVLYHSNICSDILSVNNVYSDIEGSVISEVEAQGYPDTQEFKDYIVESVSNIKQLVINEYVSSLSKTDINYKFLSKTLLNKTISQENLFSEYNLTSALTQELIKDKINSCVNSEFDYILNLGIDNSSLSEKLRSFNYSRSYKVEPVCCAFSQCGKCCEGDECKYNKELYPVIFVHGHDFSKDVSPERNLEMFNDFQDNLEKERYINAGAISFYARHDDFKDSWSSINRPISIKISYYLDTLRDEDNYVVIPTKSEPIDSYSVRLDEIINSVKEKTGRDKVIIVSYSMGGLVSRRYIQLFGDDSIDKLVMIATPNNGINESASDYCSFFGNDLECQDMTVGSLFLDNVNSAPPISIPVYNIIGTGCNTYGEDGDGAVTASSARFDYGENVYLNGSCSTLQIFHTEVLDLDKYPEVYEMVFGFIKS